jgi:hypothetical protein
MCSLGVRYDLNIYIINVIADDETKIEKLRIEQHEPHLNWKMNLRKG